MRDPRRDTRSKRSQRPAKSIATRDDQTRKTRRAQDDPSRMTSRTKKSQKTRSSRAPVPTPEVAVPVIPIEEEYDDDMLTEASPVTRAPPADAATAVSRLPGGEDPPEEQNAAIVLYDPNKKVARDPTMYDPNPLAILPVQAEPEGDKINRKKSMFADAHLMNEVHRERDEEAERRRSSRRKSNRRSMGNRLKESFKWARPSENDALEPPEDGPGNQLYLENGPMSEPEGLTSDELPAPKRKSKRKSQKKRESTSRPKPRSMGDRLKQSFNWNRTDMQFDLEAMGSNEESGGYDSPSILTNHNPPGKEKEEEVQQVLPNRQDEGRNYHEDNRRASSNRRQSRKRNGKKKEGLFSSFKRSSFNFARDGVDSENESFHGEEEYNPGMARESRASC